MSQLFIGYKRLDDIFERGSKHLYPTLLLGFSEDRGGADGLILRTHSVVVQHIAPEGIRYWLMRTGSYICLHNGQSLDSGEARLAIERSAHASDLVLEYVTAKIGKPPKAATVAHPKELQWIISDPAPFRFNSKANRFELEPEAAATAQEAVDGEPQPQPTQHPLDCICDGCAASREYRQ